MHVRFLVPPRELTSLWPPVVVEIEVEEKGYGLLVGDNG